MSAAPSPSFLKVIALLLIFTLAPGMLYFMYTRTGGPESKKELAFQRNLRYALMAGTDTLDLAPLTEWNWKTVCALQNGISEEQLADVTGFEYEHFAELHWNHLPGYWTLLFFDSEREANWGMTRPVTPVRVPRKELADLKLPSEVIGSCVDAGELVTLQRHAAPVGESPIVIDFGAIQGEGS